jgi:hypothetical protein
MSGIKTNRCVHCLGSFPPEDMTEDHVPPSSWYPDTTPSSVQHWKVPSCTRCNKDLGRKEQDFLVRFGLCSDPSTEETSGLAPRALRTLGLDAGKLSEREQRHRGAAKAKIRNELMLYSKVAGATIPGLGAPDGDTPEALALPIAHSDLSLIAEKLARGFEYKRAGRYIESPYGIRTFIPHPSKFVTDPSRMMSRITGKGQFDLGPGFRVKYVFSLENSLNIAYWILLWGRLCLSALIVDEEALRLAEPSFSKPKGLTREDIARMRKYSAGFHQ